MKFLILSSIALLLVSCSHTPTSQDYMATCRTMCHGKVAHYQDDSVNCECYADKK